MHESSTIVFPDRDFDPGNRSHLDAFLMAIAPGAPVLQALPTLLDCLRVELDGARKRGRAPVKILVHGDCVPALMGTARAEGEFDANASLAAS